MDLAKSTETARMPQESDHQLDLSSSVLASRWYFYSTTRETSTAVSVRSNCLLMTSCWPSIKIYMWNSFFVNLFITSEHKAYYVLLVWPNTVARYFGSKCWQVYKWGWIYLHYKCISLLVGYTRADSGLFTSHHIHPWPQRQMWRSRREK